MYAITTQSKSLGTRQALCLSLHSYESTSTFSQLAVSAPITSGQELVRKLVVVFQVINHLGKDCKWKPGVTDIWEQQVCDISRCIIMYCTPTTSCTRPLSGAYLQLKRIQSTGDKCTSPNLFSGWANRRPNRQQSWIISFHTHIVGLSKISFSLSLA